MKEVAEYECRCICHIAEYGPCDCHCVGTKREWPRLHEQCKYCAGKGTRTTHTGSHRVPCWDCNNGYNMNVTLETITETINKDEGISHFEIDYWGTDIEVWLIPPGQDSSTRDDVPYGAGPTLMEAFCSALLAYKVWSVEHSRVHKAHVEGCADYGEEYCNYNCVDMADKDRQLAMKDVRIEELENIINPPAPAHISLENYIIKAQKEHPPITKFKVLSRFMGGARVQCRCGNIFEYERDEVMCRKCRCLFPMGLFNNE